MQQTQTTSVRGATERSLAAAIALFTLWTEERERSPLDRTANAFFRLRRDLNASERRWIAGVVYGSVRHLSRQKALLDALKLPDTPENRVRLWILLPEENEALPTFPHTQSLVATEALAAALATLPTEATPAEYLRTTLSFTDTMASELEALLGAEVLTAGLALNQQAPTTVRVNTLRTTRGQVQDILPDAEATSFSPWGLRLSHRVNINDMPGFREGFFEVQEEASQIAALLTEVRPGQTVVDVGAGAGGKTLAVAAMMQNRGSILALDTAVGRLDELRKRIKRSGVTIAQPLLLPADEQGLWEESGKIRLWHKKADCVLLDAPCTGSGVLRRSPDAKWREWDTTEMARLQGSLLEQSAVFVKPGGSLCYVTCAFERWQNEEAIARFLETEAGKGFMPEAFPAKWPALKPDPFLRTWPHRHQLDAFFMARLRKTT